jgi:hypothetical protein
MPRRDAVTLDPPLFEALEPEPTPEAEPARLAPALVEPTQDHSIEPASRTETTRRAAEDRSGPLPVITPGRITPRIPASATAEPEAWPHAADPAPLASAPAPEPTPTPEPNSEIAADSTPPGSTPPSSAPPLLLIAP